MPLSEKQAHVLDNLSRVVSRPYKLSVASPRILYELDGEDCTQTINALINHRYVIRHPRGRLERAGEQRLPPLEAYRLLREALLQPALVHRDPNSASARAANAG